MFAWSGTLDLYQYSISWQGCMEETSSPFCDKETKRDREVLGSWCPLQEYISSDLTSI